MSLSFVSKTIQTTTASGDFEENPIENPQETGVNRNHASSSGLFDQLRKNKEQEEAEREEFQRSIMRGTLTLNEEDAAHLDFLAKQKEKERTAMEQTTELALEEFRTAQSERTSHETPKKMGDSFHLESKSGVKPLVATIPQLVMKKRKRVDGADQANHDKRTNGVDTSSTKDISTLLSGYSSSSDDE